MGVKSCTRAGCESIMCDTYIPEVGYICYECQQELKTYINSLRIITPCNEYQVIDYLQTFVRIKKGMYKSQKLVDINEFFNKYTKTEV